jgi:hypothetical protein
MVQPFKLTKDQLRDLGGVCTEIVRDLEGVHSNFFDNVRTHWRWYEAEPKTARKTHPWPGASNFVAPIIRTQADSRTAQDFSLIWGSKDKLYTGSSDNETFRQKYLASVMDFGNWTIDYEVKPFWTLMDWIHERNVLGCSVFSVAYEEELRNLFAPGSLKPQLVVTRRGVRWTHWPAEKILWQPGIDIREADEIVTQRLLSPSKLLSIYGSEKGYDKDRMGEILKFSHEHGSPGAEVQAEKEARAGIDPNTNVSRRPVHDVRCLWLEFPAIKNMGIPGLADAVMLQDPDTGDRTAVPIIVELHPDNQAVLRVLPNTNLTADGNPFFAAYYRRQVGYARGVGLSKILEQPQRGASSVINQAFDARTLQNAMPFKTVDAKLKQQPITPAQGVYLSNMGDIEAFPLPGPSQMDPVLANMMQVYAERAGGSNDPVIGRESKSGGHPSPATNYLGQLEQSAKMASTPTFIMDDALSAAGLYTLSLYQQWDTDETGRINRVFGEADAERIREWLFPQDEVLVGNLQLRLTAMSPDNQQSEVQKAMMISQVTVQYFGNAMKLLQVLGNPNAPQVVKDGAVKAFKVLGVVHQRFLEAAEYDEAQEAIMMLEEGNDGGGIQQLMALAQRALEAGGGQPGAAGAGGGPPPPGQPGNGAVPPDVGGGPGGQLPPVAEGY